MVEALDERFDAGHGRSAVVLRHTAYCHLSPPIRSCRGKPDRAAGLSENFISSWGLSFSGLAIRSAFLNCGGYHRLLLVTKLPLRLCKHLPSVPCSGPSVSPSVGMSVFECPIETNHGRSSPLTARKSHSAAGVPISLVITSGIAFKLRGFSRFHPVPWHAAST